MSNSGQRVLNLLRKMIVDGEFPSEERLAEVPTAERLGVSRMPVRMAFRTLEQEGLLVQLGARSFAIKQITADDLASAVEVRGVLEGLAARQATERGITPELRETLLNCLEQGDQLFAKGYVSEKDLAVYHDINKRFHQPSLQRATTSPSTMALARNEHLPFASVSSFAVDRNNLDREYRRFNFAHMQHHTLVDALLSRQGARAEMIMREHANATLRYAHLFPLHRQDALKIIK
jgi:GntR family transcriptional regulator of vanillate catabolism